MKREGGRESKVKGGRRRKRRVRSGRGYVGRLLMIGLGFFGLFVG